MFKTIVLFVALMTGPLVFVTQRGNNPQVQLPNMNYQLKKDRFQVVEWGDLLAVGSSGPYYMILEDKLTKKHFLYVQNKDGSGSFQAY